MSEHIQRWNKGERIKQGMAFLVNRFFRYSQYLLEWLPYNENRICCVTLTRKGYADNMMYVTQSLMERCAGIEVVWVTKYPHTCGCAARNGIKVVKYHTARHFCLQFTSRILLSDDSLYHGLIKRRRQVYINVWHGGINYKRLGREGICFEDPLMGKLFKLRNPPPDYMVAGSSFFAENMKSAFGFSKTVFLKSGLPRNDVLFHSAPLRGKFKKHYNIENRRVILYAPTFRGQGDAPTAAGIDFEKLAETAHNRYGGEWTVVYRNHYFARDKGFNNGNVIDASEYGDMQEILIDTDILVSDYSSCMWDYSFLYRPIIVYASDEAEYCGRERGLTTAGKKMPYPKAKNMNELLELVEKHDFNADVMKIMEHHKEMGAYDSGEATKYVTEFIISKMQKKGIGK